jgi:hypothetical protein
MLLTGMLDVKEVVAFFKGIKVVENIICVEICDV